MNKVKLNINEIIFITIGITVLIVSSIITKSNVINIIISIAGFIYVFFIGKKLKQAYFYGIINVTLYGIILLNDQMYAGAIYNLLYSLPFLIYGYFYWQKKEIDDINILNKKKKMILAVIVTFGIIISLITYFVTKNIITSLDVTTTTLGCIGIYLLATKYQEQWPIWIISNTLNSILWLFLTVNNIMNINILIMWILYTINSIHGYKNWQSKDKNNNHFNR